MKQTNNAIKFLLAQYRAIFKHAYLKGLASAVIMTAGLAAGAANADPSNNKFGDVGGTTDISIDGDTTNYFSGTFATGSAENWAVKVSIFGENTNKTNTITNDNAAVTVSGSGSLLINTTDTKKGLTISGGSANAFSITLSGSDGINVQAGALNLTGNASEGGNVTFAASTIKIGQERGTVDAIVNLNDSASEGVATLGNSGSVLTLGDTAVVNFNGSGSGTAILDGAKLTSNGATLSFASGNGTIKAATALENDQSYTQGNDAGAKVELPVAAGKTAVFSLNGTTTERGVFHFGADSNINLHTGYSDSSGADGGVLSISGNGTAGSIVDISAGATLTSTVESGKTADTTSKKPAYISITGETGSNSELRIDGQVLTDFLSADASKDDYAGAILLKSNSILQVNSDKTVELGINSDKNLLKLDIVSGSDVASQGGKIVVSGTTTFKADNLQISSVIDSKKLASNLSVEADILTVGSDTFNAAGSYTLGISGATVHDKLVVKSSTSKFNTSTIGTLNFDGSYYVQDDDGYNTSTVSQAKDLFNLDTTVDSTVNINGGNWQSSKALTLVDGGTLTVAAVSGTTNLSPSGILNNGEFAKLALNGTVTLTSGSLNVTGASGANAVLDLTEASIGFGADTKATITLTGEPSDLYDINKKSLDEKAGYGVLVITGKTLSDFVKENSNKKVNQSTLSVGSGGVLYVSEPDIGTYDFGDITSGSSSAAAGVVSLTGAGYVVFDGNVKLANQDTTQDKALNLGNGTIVADTITLNNEHQTEKDGKKTNDPVTIVNGTSGGLIVHTGLKSTTSSEFLLGSGSSGANLTFTTDAGQAGTVAVDLTTNGTGTNKLDFNGGDWTVKNIDLATGTGADKLTIADSGADATLTTVTGNNLKAGSSDTVKVNAQGSATFATAQLTSSAVITVNGSLTLTGKKDIAEDDVAYNQGLAGVNLSGASITVDNGGVLTLGDTVLAAKDQDSSGSIIVETKGETPTVTINDALKAGTLNVKQGGELVLGMSADTSTAIFGTDGLSAEEAVALKTGLFGESYETQLEGILNLGDSKLNITWTDEAHTQTTWDNVQDFADITGGDVTTNELKQALITEVSSTDKVSGQYGAMQVDDSFLGGQSVQVDNDFGLHNAYNVGGTDYYLFKEDESGKVVAIGVEATSSDMTLAGGGHIGAVSVDKGDLSVIGGGETVFEGNVSVTGSTGAEISSFNVAAQTTASVSGDVTTTGLELAGNLNVSGKTTIQEYGEIATGSQLTTKDLTLSEGDSATETVDVDIMGNVDVSNALTLNKNTAVNIMGGTLVTKTTTLTSGAVLNVGYEVDSDIKADDPNTIFDDTQSYTAAYQTEQLKLNGGSLIVDPAYDQPAAFAAVYNLNSITDGDITDIKAGIADGKIYVGQNSVLGIGVKTLEDLKNATASYMYGQSLSADDIGAVLYMNKQFTIGQDGSVVLTALSQEKFLEHYNAGNGTGTDLSTVTDPALKNTLYLGGNTALAITADVASNSLATGDSAMIEFADANGKVIADGGQINLTGNVRATDYQVFGDADGTVTITLLNGGTYDPEGDYAINISTENGVLVGVVGADGKTSLGIAPDARAKLSGASDPVYTSLVAYANGYNGDDPDNTDAKLYYGLDKNGNKNTAYNNDVLQYSISTGNGADTEHVARLGVYAGAAQAAISAGASTYEAVSGRMGVGAQNGSVVFADNGQGAGLWVTPIYKNHDSDGFDAQGLSYGADMDMYGVALGGDFTMANGLRVGAAFNVGSGDADGQGAGAGVSNDFDYYGFSVYGGYTLDKLSIVGDISYTVVDNDAEANTGLGKATTSLDTSNLSVGVTGQYTFNLNAVDVTPHAGLRYTYIDMDDYTVKVDGSEQARYAADSMSIFSIPVGVTFSKDIASGDWTIKPTFDLTLTANVGDDSMDGSVTWAGVDNLTTNLESEVIDNFTYGATLGVAAKTGNFSFGLGVNYTGASSADEYGVSANARFVF